MAAPWCALERATSSALVGRTALTSKRGSSANEPAAPSRASATIAETSQLAAKAQARLFFGVMARRVRRSVYFPFPDKEREEQYRDLALSSHRFFMFRAFLVYGLGMGLVQLLVALAAVLVSFAFLSDGLLKARSTTIVALVVLALAGLIPTIVDRERDSLNESGQLMLVYLLAYSCCVPAFNTYLVLCTMSAVVIGQLVLCITSTAGVENRINLTLRELFKGVVINAIGCRIGCLGEQAYRDNYLSALECRNQQLLQKKLQDNVHRLLTNTFPAPIVKEIASGRVRQGHRYERVTVLQADMVGFTPLSATREPEEVLGILSDLFGHFDVLSSAHKVSKIKTIGDAYVVCSGAFRSNRGEPEDAMRIVAMGLAMTNVVATEAKTRGININVRIGVHTGNVMGGVIGTVHFHFDMWGNGVVGAMKMEEMGAKGKVHISDATAALLGGAFPLVSGPLMEASAAETYGIRTSYFVDEGALQQHQLERSQRLRAPSTPSPTSMPGKSPRLRRCSKGSGSSSLSSESGRSNISPTVGSTLMARRSIGSAVSSIGGLLSDATRLPRTLFTGSPNLRSTPRTESLPPCCILDLGTAGGVPGGGLPPALPLNLSTGTCDRVDEEAHQDLPAAGAPVGANTGQPSSSVCDASRPPKLQLPEDNRSERYSVELTTSPSPRSSTLPAAPPPPSHPPPKGGGSPVGDRVERSVGSIHKIGARAREERWLSSFRGRPSASSRSNKSKADPASTPRLVPSQRVTVRISKAWKATQRVMLVNQSASSFFFDNNLKRDGADAVPEGEGIEQEEVLRIEKEEVRRGLRGYVSQGTGIFVAQGENLIAFVALCGLYDYLCFYFEELTTDWDHLPQILIIRYVALVAPLIILHRVMRTLEARSSFLVESFASALVLLPCAGVVGFALVARQNVEPCSKCPDGAGGLYPKNQSQCEAFDVCNGTFVSKCFLTTFDGTDYCKVGQPMFYLRTLGMAHSFLHWTLIYSKIARLLLTTLIGTTAMLFAMGYVHYRPAADQVDNQVFIDAALWISVANLIGAVHYFVRNKALWQHLVLRAQQQQALHMIKIETEKCEQLLANILPPHLIGSLNSILERLELTGDASFEELITPRLTAQISSTPRDAPPAVPVALVAERYSGCSFLFAKIGGLAQLVNDDEAEPQTVIEVLQEMFNRFDMLSTIFNVQKVRKTANEYYLAAAGLPDPLLLPQPTDRAVGLASFGFAIVNVMDNVNLEIKRLGIDMQFTVQVGIDSGFAIAGIIGHKTFQYDLCGDAVNTAARMCSYSAPGRVHVSHATYRLLRHRFAAISRGEREIKGKGRMETYFLRNEPPDDQPFTTPPSLMPPQDPGPSLSQSVTTESNL